MKSLVGAKQYQAPEVLEQNYDEKCDIWSIGVILYLLITGEYPFNFEQGEDLAKAKKKEFMKHQHLELVTDEAKDLLEKMLEFDSTRRISAEQALEHKWFVLVHEI